jgi:hypothetical protein
MTTPANDDTPFDKGFRALLAGMYDFMNEALVLDGKAPLPVKVCAPIIQPEPKGLEGPYVTPPKLDGVFSPNEAEWSDEGAFFFDDDSGGAIKNPDDDIGLVYYGYDATHFYLAVAANEQLSGKLGTPYSIAAWFSHKHILSLETGDAEVDPKNTSSAEGHDLSLFKAGGAAREVRVDFSGAKAAVKLAQANGSGGWAQQSHDIALGGPVTGGSIIELAIPWADLNLSLGDPLEIQLAAVDNGAVVDTAPNLGSKIIFQDETNQIFITFEVDTSGKEVPLDKYGEIANPTPPQGKGIAFITGNQDNLCDWVPNKCALVDDGKAPDAVAGDKIWTGTFKFAPGTLLRWKYTVGTNSDEGKWSKTEEFPLTERGYDVPLDPTVKKVTIQDIFADRPMPTGTLGPGTKVIESGE